MKHTSLSKILSVLLSLCVLLCMVPMAGLSVSALDAALDTDGTTILISTAEQLAAIGVDENYPLGGSYKLTNDIDLSKWGDWTPIGYYNGGQNIGQPDQSTGVPSDKYFSGTFDGNGYTISDMTVSVTAECAYAGLFGITNKATIKNLVFENASVTANGTGTQTSQGGVVVGGTSDTSTVLENIAVCNSTVNVTNKAANNRTAAGGLVGWGATGATVKNCYVDVDVTATFNTESGQAKQMFTCGLVGAAWGGYTTASDCIFVGTLTNNYYIAADGFTPDTVYNHKNGVVCATGEDKKGSENNCYYLDTSGVNTETTDKAVINGDEIKESELATITRADLGFSGEYWRDGAGVPALIVSLPKANVNYPGYIPIYSAKQLAKIGKDDAYPLSGNYILMNDIEMSDYGNWTPIGYFDGAANKLTTETSFSGVFDGGGYTISDLTISLNGNVNYAGLFGTAYEATIENLIIRNASVSGIVSNTSAQRTYVGILVGTSIVKTSGSSNKVKNVAVYNSTVSASSNHSGKPAIAGGLWGFAEGTVEFENCYADVDVTSVCVPEDTTKQSYQTAAGGLLGATWSGTAKATNCVFVGSLTDTTYTDGFDVNGLEKTFVHKNSIIGTKMSGWANTNNNKGGVSQQNCYYLDTVDVNPDNTSGLDGTAISADALKTATAAAMKFNGYYWKNDGEGLYLAVAPVPTDDNGAIKISTADELAHIGAHSQYPRTGDYVLTADIDMSDYGNWTPLCYGYSSTNNWVLDKTVAFNGVLDGQGHTISGMTVNSSVDNNMVGLFACVTSNSTKTTVIKNLVFKDCSVTATSNKYCDAGIVAGASDVDNNISVIFSNIAIIGCSVKATVTKENASSAASVIGNGTRAQLYDVYSDADISGGCTVKNSKFGMAGMIGRAWRGYAWAEGAIFSGTLTNSTPESDYTYANGIFAYNADHNNTYPTNTSSCKNIYYNSDKLTVSTETNGGEYNGAALTKFDLGISPISVLGLSDKWMHNGTTPILKIVGDDAYVTGDATGDGKQDILDLIRLKKYMANTAEEILLIAVDLKRDQKIDANDMIYLRKALLGINNAITLDLSTAQDSVKYLGAVYTENGKLIMARENTGYELSVMAGGDIVTTLTGALSTNFPYAKLAVTVDGETEIIKVYPGTATYKLASNLDWGAHTVKVLKITEYTKGSIYAADVSFNGALNARPEDAELSIDFYGDSITAGDGVVATDRSTSEGMLEGQFSNKTYAAQTAALLGADMRAVAQSGLKTVDAVSKLSLDNNAKWGYNADVVVINLGTNDWSVISESGSAATDNGKTAEVAAINAMLNAVVNCYGSDIKIVWCYGSMGDSHGYENVIKEAVEAFAENNANVSYCSLMSAANNNGGSGHPTEAGHAAAAAILKTHITNILNAE